MSDGKAPEGGGVTALMHTVWVFTTPQELREIADKMERMWPSLRIGDSKTTHVFGGARAVAVHICADQDRMPKRNA